MVGCRVLHESNSLESNGSTLFKAVQSMIFTFRVFCNSFHEMIMPCYDLDVVCPLQLHVLEAWSCFLALRGGGMFKKWGLEAGA